MKLFDYQQEDIDRAINEGHKSIFLAYEQALGKTVTAVEFARRTGVKTVIVVAPLSTLKGWRNTVALMLPDADFYELKTDKKHVAAFGYLKAQKPGWYFLGWELMRNGVITGAYADMVIGDEIHRIQNYGKSATQLMFEQIDGEYKVALSGTPAANRPEGLFAPMHWLWPKRYKSFYTHFVDKFWLSRRNGSVIDLVREKEPGMIVKDMPFFVRRLKKDHRGDLPPVLPDVDIPCKMTREQAKIYKQFDEVALAWLEDHPVATSYPLTQEIRLRQVALAVPMVNDDGIVTFDLDAKSSKITEFIKVLKEKEGEPFFAVTHSARFIPTVIHQLAKAGIVAKSYTDGTTQAQRDHLVETLGTEYQVLIAGTAAVAEGLDGLQLVCSNGAWLSKHPNAMLNTQAGERLDRPGQKTSVQWWNFYAPDTTEEKALARLEEINENLFELYDRWA